MTATSCALAMAMLWQSLTTGGYNLAIGKDSAPNLTSGSYNVVIGDGAGADITTQSCKVRVGALSVETVEWFVSRYGTHGTTSFHFTTGEEIEKHCGYRKGTVDRLFRDAVARSGLSMDPGASDSKAHKP